MITFERKYLDVSNGETISYIEKGNSSKTLLLIHGNMASSVHMVELADELKDNYRVIMPDLRGFGNSTFNNDFTSIKDLAVDLMLFLDKLQIDEVYVAGWSTGFGVAMSLALLKPSLVKGLLSLQGMSVKGFYSTKINKNKEVLSYRLYDSYALMKQDKELNMIHDALINQDYDLMKLVWEKTLLVSRKITGDLLDLYIKETLKQRCQENINWAWVNFNISDEANLYAKGTSEYKNITCPIHITLSKLDMVVLESMVKENIDAFKHAKVYEFQHSGHCVLFDELDKLTKIIKEIF